MSVLNYKNFEGTVLHDQEDLKKKATLSNNLLLFSYPSVPVAFLSEFLLVIFWFVCDT